jgi:ADP-ribose pyrophosphatase YjhB (NUDIX family)
MSDAGTATGRRTRISAHGLCVVADRLLLVRLSAGLADGGRWALPGGGLDWGEHPAEALRRELHEETGLSGEVGAIAGVFSDTFRVGPTREGDELHFLSVVYEVTSAAGELVHEADGSTDRAAWVPLAEAAGLALVPLARYGLELLGARGGGQGAGGAS